MDCCEGSGWWVRFPCSTDSPSADLGVRNRSEPVRSHPPESTRSTYRLRTAAAVAAVAALLIAAPAPADPDGGSLSAAVLSSDAGHHRRPLGVVRHEDLGQLTGLPIRMGPYDVSVFVGAAPVCWVTPLDGGIGGPIPRFCDALLYGIARFPGGVIPAWARGVRTDGGSP